MLGNYLLSAGMRLPDPKNLWQQRTKKASLVKYWLRDEFLIKRR